jgi:hypothetical protein
MYRLAKVLARNAVTTCIAAIQFSRVTDHEIQSSINVSVHIAAVTVWPPIDEKGEAEHNTQTG